MEKGAVEVIYVCHECIKISCETIDIFKRPLGKKKSPEKKQCPACGLWWYKKGIKTIKFVWNKFKEEWYRFNYFFGEQIFSPLECTQRQCKEQARHKIKSKGKRKYKCDKHAGVCIIA